MDGDLSMRVLSNALINVLIPGSPEGLDPQNSTCTFIKFNCLEDKGGERHTHSKHTWVASRRFIPASKETPACTHAHTLANMLQELPYNPLHITNTANLSLHSSQGDRALFSAKPCP